MSDSPVKKMASGTRSGRLLKHKGNSSLRSETVGGKRKYVKAASASGSTATSTKNKVECSTLKDVKGSTTSGSAATDSSSFRRSARETPSKKTREPSPSSWKSERFEKESPLVPSDKKLEKVDNKRPHSPVPSDKKLEKVDKKRPQSPVRRSERIEKHGTPGSSSSKKGKYSSSSPRKKKKDVESEKTTVSVSVEQSKNTIQDIKSSGSSKRKKKKKKMMNARCYRALLLPSKPKAKSADADSMNNKDDTASRSNSCDSGSIQSSGFKQVQKDGDECNGREEEKVRWKHSDIDSKEAQEISSSGSREHAELTLENNEGRKPIRLGGKRKFKETSPVSNSSGSSSQSSDEEKEINGKDDRLKLEAPELVAATSEGRALATVTSPEFGGDFGGSKSEKMATNLDYDISVTPTNKEFANPDSSTVDFPISFPFRSKSENMKQCNVCCKPQRVCNGSLAKEMCSCKLGSKNDLLISSSEKACEAVSTLRDPCECETLLTGSQENKATGDQKTEAREYVSLPEKENCIVASADTKYLSVPMTEDRGRLGVIDGVGITEDRLNSTHLKKNSLANQTDGCVNACLICNNPGQLLCCDGKDCKRCYHLSCLNPPLQEVPVGGWLCHFCVKKKLELGVHSVSEGIESVWDVREGMQNGRQYFVKYKGLSHVHNLWIPECQLLLEAPNLLTKFNRKHQKEKATRWKQEWTKPHRLLQKRLLMPKNLSDECIRLPGDKLSYCSHEWFVKWKGLGYESASWELENSSILCSPEAAMLIKDYERRRKEAKRISDPSRADKALQVKKDPFHKLTRLPDECPGILDNDHINSINRLCEFWHKSHNAVLIDDQERIVKSVLFIAALFSHACRPFLVISTISSLSLWESEFMRLAPSANIVVYNWDKEIRRMIRTLEFYDEGACVMFRVLVSHPDAIIEDFEDINCIAWEAVFVDLCQNSRISKHLEQLKCLTTDFRLLLLSGHLKDSVAEYANFLSFLDSGGKENGISSLNIASDDSTGSLAILKERFAHYLAYERRLDSGKFVEYWVPVQLSNVQLEQYCATLVANSIALLSCPKVDQTGAFRDILISTRKCCDHPYLVDKQLQSSLTKGLPADRFLDIGVKASGKLFLLDKILQDLKKQGLRVLILFQKSIGGAGRNPIGDILDDFICQRYGADSYERIDSGLVMSKKVAALNMFNDKKNGRFVFLIENRACLPSVKLSSVDVVIIYDSDWNPLNDLRALQRVTIESQFEHVKVFRLYSSCTVEEKVLIFAKKDMILESNIQNISPSNSHMLLSWGAFYLFSKLDEFHQVDNLSNHSEASIDLLIVNDAVMKFVSEVMFEVLSQLPGKYESCSTGNCSILVRAMQSGASYSRNISLIGEKDGIASLDKDPPSFWSNLLENRYPKWRFVSDQSQRSRKRPQHFDVESKKVTEVGNDEVRRKHRKLSMNTVDPITLQNGLQDRTKGTSVGKDSMVNDTLKSYVSNPPASISPHKTLFNPTNMLKEPGCEAYESQVYVQSQCTKSSVDIVNDVNHNQHVSSKYVESSKLHYSPTAESERRKKMRDLQSSLHLSLKPELEKLCDVLKLPEEVKSLAQTFLEYIMNNHQVSREPETTLQAFKISLCWRAASFLKHKVDHRECLALAKKYLKFVCDEEQAASVYSKLRLLKKQFENKNDLSSSQNHLSVSREVGVDQQLLVEASNSMQSNQPELVEIREISDGPKSSEQLVLEQQQDPVHESPSKIQQNLGSLQDVLLEKRVDLIHEICSKRADDLLLKQQVEISDFNVHREEEKIKMKTARDSDVAFVRSIHIDHIIRNNKIKLLNQIYLKKMDKYDQHMKSQRSKLAAMQEAAKSKEDEIRVRRLEEAKAGSLKESFDNLPLTESGFRLEEFKIVSSQFEGCDGAGNMIAPRPASDQICSNMRETCQGESNELVVEHPESPSLLHTKRVEDLQVETEIPACKTLSMIQLDYAEPTGASVSRSNPHQNSDDICTARSGESTELSVNLLKVPSGIPSERIGDLLLDVDNIVSQSEKRVRRECVEPPGSSQSISRTLLSPTIGRLSMETEITPSRSDTMNAEGNMVDAVLIDSVMGTPAITAHRDLEGGDNTDNTHLISSPQQIQAEVQSDITNAVTNAVSTGSDPMLIASTTSMLPPTSVGGDTHEGEANHDISCLIASLQKNQAEFAPPLPSLTCSGCDVLVTSNQISSICEHEGLAVSGATRPDQGDSSSQQIAIPALHPVNGVPSPVEQTTHNTCTLNSTSSEVPASVDISLTENVQQNTDVPLEYEGEPCTFTNSFAPQTEIPLLQPISGAVALGEQTNQFVSSSGVPPLPPNSGTRLERTRPEHLAGGQSEPGSQVSQLLSWLAVPVLGTDPLQNELMRIRKQDELCTKKHDEKKVQLESERDQEIERIQRKYEVLLQDAETEFVHDKKILETVYNKVLLNRILAEEFRAKFIENKGSAPSFPGPRPNTAHQFLPASHTPRTPRQPSTSSPTLTPNSANLPVLQTPGRTPSTRPPVGPRAMASVPPCPIVRNTPVFPTNQVRSHFSPVLPPRMNHQLGTEARAPAPHLVRFMPPSSTPVTLPLQASQVSVQQQPVPNLGSATIVVPNTPTPRAPLSGTYHQPAVPAVSPLSHSVTLSVHRLPRDGHSSPGADLPNLSQSIDVGTSLDGLLPTNLPPKENESTPSSSEASRAAAAAAEGIVCISDEE